MAKTLDEMRGVTPDDMKQENENQKQQERNQAEPTDESTETKQQKAKQAFSGETETSTSNISSNVNEVETQESTEDANEERQRNINTLQNQFGTNLEDIPENFREEALKMAKSYRHAQGKYTQATQQRSELENKLEEAQKAQQVVQNLDGFLQQNPDIDRMIQQRMNGNPQQTGQEPQGQPNSVPQSQGQLTEQQLINAGYVSSGELQGLDDFARKERLMDARIEYKADQKLNQYQQKLQEADQNFQQKKQKQQIDKLNKKRKDDGIDRFVSDYGVDLSQLDKQTIQAVTRRAELILDPSGNGNLIDQDAYYDALRKELALRGNLPEQAQQQRANINQLQNTGVSVNKRTDSRRPQSLNDIVEQKEQERRNSLANTHPRVAKN